MSLPKRLPSWLILEDPRWSRNFSIPSGSLVRKRTYHVWSMWSEARNFCDPCGKSSVQETLGYHPSTPPPAGNIDLHCFRHLHYTKLQVTLQFSSTHASRFDITKTWQCSQSVRWLATFEVRDHRGEGSIHPSFWRSLSSSVETAVTRGSMLYPHLHSKISLHQSLKFSAFQCMICMDLYDLYGSVWIMYGNIYICSSIQSHLICLKLVNPCTVSLGDSEHGSVWQWIKNIASYTSAEANLAQPWMMDLGRYYIQSESTMTRSKATSRFTIHFKISLIIIIINVSDASMTQEVWSTQPLWSTLLTRH